MWRSKIESLCTTTELNKIITEPAGGYYMEPNDGYNEVYPKIYVGDVATALSINELKRMGVTHVLNAAQGKDKLYYVNTCGSYYESNGMKFLGVPAIDHMNFQLEPYFETSADFIDDAIKTGGKCLVHCRQGVSRSATLAIAYLMIKKGMTVQNATKTVRTEREIMPNEGFLQQLCNLNEKLHRDRKMEELRNGIHH